MAKTALDNLIPVLQIAVGPVILISGVGLLLLSLTNRFGRAVDRSRQLLQDMRQAGEVDRRQLAGQIQVLYRRARLIRISITLAATSILLAAILIITLFFTVLASWQSALVLSWLFTGCLLALIGSLLTFLLDIHLSLKALKLEMGHGKPGPAA